MSAGAPDEATTASEQPGEASGGALPEATLVRLHTYRRVLTELAAGGVVTVSSEELARASGVNSAQVRKDLSFVGSRGTRGVGYGVDDLRSHLSEALGLTDTWNVVLVGVGNLGRALAHYAGFEQGGFAIAALVDASPQMVGTEVAGVRVEPIEALEEVVARERIDIAVLAVPAAEAQVVTDRLVAAGVAAVLNFAPAHVEAPADVRVRRVDLSTELGVLAYYARQRRAEGGAPDEDPRHPVGDHERTSGPLDRPARVRHAPPTAVDPSNSG